MSTPTPEKDRRRVNAAGHVAAGGALVGAAAAANYANDRALERRGLEKPVKAAVKRKGLRPAHARYAAAKLGVRGLQVTGIPMAAYGAYNLVKPDKKVPRVNAKDDIARQVARGVTFQDARDDYRRRVAKRQLTREENEKLVRRKKAGTSLSLAAGTMGLGALALRSPEVARVVAGRSARLAGRPKVQRLIRMEPSATKASNTLGIAAIGTGSAGSFNYASQQRLEAKQVKKGLPDKMRHAGRMRRVLGYDSRTKQIILDNPADPTTPYRIARGGKKVPRSAQPEQMRLFEKGLPSVIRRGGGGLYGAKRRTAREAGRKAAKHTRVMESRRRAYLAAAEGQMRANSALRLTKPDADRNLANLTVAMLPQQAAGIQANTARMGEIARGQRAKKTLPVLAELGKRDDKFLRRYRDRISPDAERGYNSMRRQRNKDRAWAATQTGLTGINAAGTVAAIRARSKPFTVLGAGLTAFSGAQAVKHGAKARGYDKGPMEGIRRKARSREDAGLFGPGRGKEPVDASSKHVGKALVPRIPMPRSLPKGLRRTPTIRRSYVARRPSGRMVSVRGGFG